MKPLRLAEHINSYIKNVFFEMENEKSIYLNSIYMHMFYPFVIPPLLMKPVTTPLFPTYPTEKKLLL